MEKSVFGIVGPGTFFNYVARRCSDLLCAIILVQVERKTYQTVSLKLYFDVIRSLGGGLIIKNNVA